MQRLSPDEEPELLLPLPAEDDDDEDEDVLEEDVPLAAADAFPSSFPR